MPKSFLTVKAMWEAWFRRAAAGQAYTEENVRQLEIAYYAGAHDMLVKMQGIFEDPRITPNRRREEIQRTTDEMDNWAKPERH